MKVTFKNEKLKELTLIDSYDNAFSETINRKLDEANAKLLSTISNQCKAFKEICLDELVKKRNKSAILYLFFMTIELYTLFSLVKEFKLCSYKASFVYWNNGEREKKLCDLNHNLDSIKGIIKNNINYPGFQNLQFLLTLYSKIEQFDDYTVHLMQKYTSLRYNCDKKGNYVFDDLSVSETLINDIKEALKYVEV